MELYGCTKCHLVIEKIVGSKDIKCCDETLKKLEVNNKEASKEKHLPQVSYQDSRLKVNVLHDMSNQHYIAFILVKTPQQVLRQDFTPDQRPEAEFLMNDVHGEVEVYEYCNLHGLWKTTFNID